MAEISPHAATAVLYVLPFAAYYLGVVVRYFAKFLRDRDAPPLGEQLWAATAFSVIAVGPLLPAIELTFAQENVAPGARRPFQHIAYIFILIVLLQEGLVLHEKAMALVKRLVRDVEKRGD